jgi:hypothetical protein
MKTKEDFVWESLLAQSAPAFAAETTPPFGLTTRVLAAVREERQQAAAGDRVGRRAIWASLIAVLVLGAVTVARHQPRQDDVDLPVRNLALVENVQVS